MLERIRGTTPLLYVFQSALGHERLRSRGRGGLQATAFARGRGLVYEMLRKTRQRIEAVLKTKEMVSAEGIEPSTY